MYNHLILIKGQDKTDQVKHIEYQGGLCKITFKNKTYNYSRKDVVWLNADQTIHCDDRIVTVKGLPLFDVQDVVIFGSFCKVFYKNQYTEIYNKKDIEFEKNVLLNAFSKNAFGYFKAVAQEVSIKADGTYNILGQQYSNIRHISKSSVLGSFLSQKPSVKTYDLPKDILYPFGINRSQKTAVENALTSQISIIQGPPGTGKTQTILNIIANVVLGGKTVAVVSNNNSAIENIIQKLEKHNLAFTTALLGSQMNKKKFLENQKGVYPNLREWHLDDEEESILSDQIKQLTEDLNKQMAIQEKSALLQQELKELEAEQHYFDEYLNNMNVQEMAVPKYPSKKLLYLCNEFEKLSTSENKFTFFSKLVLGLKYGFGIFNFLKSKPEEVVPNIQREYYRTKKEELLKEQRQLKNEAEDVNLDIKFKDLAEHSLLYFKNQISKKYGKKKERIRFDSASFKKDSAAFTSEYPIILSTTYSIKNCLNENFTYDYLIVDEASQVNLVTGILAMSCAKNMVIVGDLKQLPNVITQNDQAISKKFWIDSMPRRFDFAGQSLLSSAATTWTDAKTVLLREHYRCDYDIINFCNQKFYNNQLLIMTKHTDDPDAIPTLKLFKTNEGGHARNHVNQREIDIIKNEILPEYTEKGEKDIGIITPFRDQVNAMKTQLPDFCEIDTVHKFQGREKNIIILSTVLNEINDFVNDPNMINVAVSRAVKSLSVVTSGHPLNEKTYYGDLAHYIEYNNYSVVNSKTYSVFDLLYKEYNEERKKYLSKHKRVSEWDSENLLYGIIEDVLKNYDDLGCACHVPLSMLIKNTSGFNDRECQYVRHPFTHVDFLLFRKIDKSPVLIIEVDGVHFHQKGSKQSERDQIKNHVLQMAEIPLVRLRTDGSQEERILREKLDQIFDGCRK